MITKLVYLVCLYLILTAWQASALPANPASPTALSATATFMLLPTSLPPTATLTLTSTPIATASPTPLPTATLTPAALTANPVPIAAMSCQDAPDERFQAIWAGQSDVQQALGCPAAFHPREVAQAWDLKTSYQPFEHGQMIWTERQVGWYGPPFVYVFYEDGTSQSLPDEFDPNVDPINGNEAPPTGRFEPVLGFGKIWREQLEVRQKLGWAVAEEMSGPGVSQAFVTGHMLWLSQTNRMYVFSGEWVRVFDQP